MKIISLLFLTALYLFAQERLTGIVKIIQIKYLTKNMTILKAILGEKEILYKTNIDLKN